MSKKKIACYMHTVPITHEFVNETYAETDNIVTCKTCGHQLRIIVIMELLK